MNKFTPRPISASPRPTPEQLQQASAGLDLIRTTPTEPAVLPAPLAPTPAPERPAARRRQRELIHTLTFKATEPFARMIYEHSEKEGGVRRFLARTLKEAGYQVPEDDLDPPRHVRRTFGRDKI